MRNEAYFIWYAGVSNFEDDAADWAFSAACQAIVIVYAGVRKALSLENAASGEGYSPK